ncbi:hypothetical protein [Natronomonas salsuginis]|jgi:hypothetical protein|uniref:DUF8009 domain-containing protein n=1 Tax=Natronomonas salsuginis TaxID=2217661 RepID=A0A4U5JI89_9EURY|nr:hypothetical protein [Natronomonas salsuginis]TKR28061.1 hypothetical protein DM868_02970 [Natronomonas salsuginis]
MPPNDSFDDDSGSVGRGAADTGATDADSESGTPADTEASPEPAEVDEATDDPTDVDGDHPGNDESGDEPDTADEGDGEDEEEYDPASISNIERIVLDPDELVRSFAYNGQEEIGRKGKVVFSLTPPFTETMEPALRHLEDDSRESKEEGEIHLRPFRLVFDGRKVIDQRPTRRLAIEELDEEEPDDATIEAWLDEAMATWTAHVRDNLAESVDIFSPHGMAIVDVEFEESSEAVEESWGSSEESTDA